MKKIMIYTKNRKINTSSLLTEIKINVNIIMLTNFMVCGIIIGAGLIFLSEYNFGLFLDRIVFAYFLEYSNIIILFLRELLISIIFVFAAFYFGLSCIGTPVICILPVIEGIYFGLSISSFLFRNEFKGIFSSILCLLPGFSVLATLSLIAYSVSFDMSSRLSAEIFSDNKISKNLKAYSYQFIIITVLAILSAIISSATKLLYF